MKDYDKDHSDLNKRQIALLAQNEFVQHNQSKPWLWRRVEDKTSIYLDFKSDIPTHYVFTVGEDGSSKSYSADALLQAILKLESEFTPDCSEDFFLANEYQDDLSVNVENVDKAFF